MASSSDSVPSDAGVVLAKLGDQVWLVAGEDHLDELLMGELSADVPVRMEECSAWHEVYALWEQSGEAAAEGAQPWALNPQLMPRVLGKLGLLAPIIQFAAWSAAIDASAEAAIAHTAAWLAANPGGALLLRQVQPDPAVPGHADLQRLREQLVRAALGRAGAAPDVVQAETVGSGDPAEADRLHIITVPAG